MLFATRLNEIASTVANYQAEIARLQQLISDQQQHSQQLQSAEQAAESAIAQVETALMMINAIAPDQIEIFKSAIDAKFSKDAIAELPPVADDEVAEPDTEELEPESDIENDSNDSETTTVDVEVIPEVELEVGEMPEVTSNGNGHYKPDSEPSYLSYNDLVKIARPKLIKLSKGLVDRPQHQSAAILAQVLADKGITQADIDSIE